MLSVLLWLILLVLCWPLALIALVLWPVVWLLTLPFRLLGIAVEGVFGLLRALLFLPARVLGGKLSASGRGIRVGIAAPAACRTRGTAASGWQASARR